MTDHEAERPMARPIKRLGFRLYGTKPQLTPEEMAARHAAETARKIRDIFARKAPKPAA